jgi:hypothetical protein
MHFKKALLIVLTTEGATCLGSKLSAPTKSVFITTELFRAFSAFWRFVAVDPARWAGLLHDAPSALTQMV